MSSIKKLLTFVVVLTMVLGTMIPAFAAVPADVEGTDYEDAAAMLGALEIMVGDAETGNFRPDDAIKRSEFAKLAVISLGLEDAASAARSYGLFPDVSNDHWALGYINVAAGQGIIIGDDTGNFRPDDTITYAEALTILVRELGYKDSFLQGSWPANFVSKAAELDLTSGVAIDSAQPATRGNSAILLVNTLQTEVVKQTSFGDENSWQVSTVTLMDDKLELNKYEEVMITAVPKVNSSLDENEVTLNGSSIANGDYEVVANMDINNLLGVEADVYLNDDDEVVHINVTTDEDDVFVGQITKIAGLKATVQFADGSNEEYDLVAAPTVYIDNASDVIGSLAVGHYGTFMLNSDDEVEFTDLYTIADYAVITSINVEDEYVKGIKASSDSRKIKLNDNDGYKIFKAGKEITMEDLAENDVLFKTANVNELDGDVYTYAFVVNNTLEGELNRVRDAEVKIDDENMDMIDDMSYSLDNADSVSAYDIDTPDPSVFEDVVGENVKAYLDLKGDVVYLVTDVEITSGTQYGVVVKNNEITMDTVKMFNDNGNEVVYNLDEDVAPANVNDGDIVEFEMDNDGTIDYDNNYNVLATLALINAGNTKELAVTAFNDDNDYIVAGGNKYYVTDDTVMMSYFDGVAVDPGMVNWEDIKDSTVPAGLTAVVKADSDGINAELVIFTENYSLSGDTKLAYLTDDMYYDGDWKVDVVMADGSNDTFVITNTVKASGIVEGDFVVFDTNQSGEMSTVERAVYDNNAAANLNAVDNTWTIVAGTVKTISNDVVKLASGSSYKVLDATKIYTLTLDEDDNTYDEINEADLSDLDEDSVVRIITNTDDDIEVIVVVE